MDITSVHDSNQILIHVLSSQRSHGEESNIHVPWVAPFIIFLHLSRAGLSPQAYVYVIQKLQQNGEMRIIVFKKQ